MSGLIEAALDGGFETPLWGGFLDGLRQATGADYALLAYQAPGAPLEEAILCFSGAARPEDVQQTFHERVYPLARSYTGPPMPDGRPFGLFDLQLHGERMNRDLALPYGLTQRERQSAFSALFTLTLNAMGSGGQGAAPCWTDRAS